MLVFRGGTVLSLSMMVRTSGASSTSRGCALSRAYWRRAFAPSPLLQGESKVLGGRTLGFMRSGRS